MDLQELIQEMKAEMAINGIVEPGNTFLVSEEYIPDEAMDFYTLGGDYHIAGNIVRPVQEPGVFTLIMA